MNWSEKEAESEKESAARDERRRFRYYAYGFRGKYTGGAGGIDRGAAQLGAQRRLSRRILNYLNRDLSDAGG